VVVPRQRASFVIVRVGLLIAALCALLGCKGGRPRAEASDHQGGGVDAGRVDVSVDVEPAHPTYWNRIAGILETHCTKCHAEGGIAPMPLETFAQAKTHAGAIAFQTRERHMPPWLPETKACAPLS
jgi:hypothetical protein